MLHATTIRRPEYPSHLDWNAYSMLNRHIEDTLLDTLSDLKMGCIGFSVLAQEHIDQFAATAASSAIIRLDDLRISRCVQQTGGILRGVRLQLHQPAVTVRILIDLLR